MVLLMHDILFGKWERLQFVVVFIAFFISASALAVQKGDTATVSVTGTLVGLPDCTINGNNNVNVDFGDEVVTRKIDGNNFKQPISFTLECNDLASNELTVSIRGAAADFGSGYLSTNRTGLGIRLFNGTAELPGGTEINFTLPDLPKLYAAPVAQDPDSLTAGSFTGVAALVFNYQ